MKFYNYKFRCSGLGYLMTKPRKKSETLSETAKSYLKDVYMREVYDRDYILDNKYLEKGNYAEEDSLTLVTQNLKKLLTKNKKEYKNKWVKGTPDVILDDKIIDIKTCWDMRTFMNKDSVESNYFWQLQGYMWLTNKDSADLIYTLVNTPEHLIVQEKSRRMYQTGFQEGTEEWDNEESRIEKLMLFDDIKPKLRMRVYTIDREDIYIEQIQDKVKEARNYLNTLKLKE